MDKILSQLIRISNTVGRDSSLVQGGGGNTSVKTRDGKYMYVKTSGTKRGEAIKIKGKAIKIRVLSCCIIRSYGNLPKKLS